MLYNTPKDRTNLLVNGQHNIEGAGMLTGKYHRHWQRFGQGCRTTAFQITQDGDAIIAPSSSGYQRVWRDLFEFNLANQVNFLKNML